MKFGRKLGTVAALAIVTASSLTLISATAASAANKPGLETIDNCGGLFDLKERVAGTLVIAVTEGSSDANEVWTLTAIQQEYGIVTGARTGAPINLVPNPLPALAFSPAEGGFSSTANITDTPGSTHGFSYTATRTSPTPLTCTGGAFWTDHGTTTPDPLNPTGKPDSAPALTGATEADRGTHVVQLQFDQEMLAAAGGIPVTSRFSATVNGVNRNVTAVAVVNDNPPNKAVLSLTLAGAVLPANGTVTVQYRQPLSSSDPQLQDLDHLLVPSFAPVSVPVF
jgi:Putative flagellar system-associated repeat